MSHKRLLIAGTIIAFIIIAGFILSVPHTRDLPVESVGKTEKQSVPEVALRDTYKKGVHTITGSLEVPNVCTTVSASSSLASEGGAITISITTTSDEGICLERNQMMRFTTTVTAPAGLPITASVNGVLATTIEL